MASRGQTSGPRRPTPRLYLVAPEVADLERLAAALAQAVDGADIAAVLVRLAGDDDERTLINRAKALAPVIQAHGAAYLLDGHPDIVARAGADGAHFDGIDAFSASAAALQPERIAGCGGLNTRHDAMLAGEAGADYVLFGEPDRTGSRPSFEAIEERVAWWAEVFEVPCVGYATTLAEIDRLAQAGADFVAAGSCIFEDPRGPAVAAADAARRLVLPEAVG
jgi:thiamine-phosphate pyrophosphorylase